MTLNPLKLLRRKVELDERIASAMERMALTGEMQVKMMAIQMGLIKQEEGESELHSKL